MKLVAIGANPAQVAGTPFKAKSWSEEKEIAMLQDFDIGIMPLPDGPFERGKCGYKLIQYMACGKPVVASPVGVNKEIVQHGKNGFLAEDPEQWLKYLTRLATDPNLRDKMGNSGRAQVEEKYSLAVAAPRLLYLLRSARR